MTSYFIYIWCIAGVTDGNRLTACTPRLGEFPPYTLYGKHDSVYYKCLYHRCTLSLYAMGTLL